MDKKNVVGIIGVRGYGVIYSGFETFTIHLINKSNNTYYYLYSRKSYPSRRQKKTNFAEFSIPVVGGKYLETPIYSFVATIKSLRERIRTVLYLGVSNCFPIFLQKVMRRKVLVNVDGLDWKRKRWNIFGRIYLKICEVLTVFFADIIIADSKEVFDYYQSKYHFKKIVFIPYGAEVLVRKQSSFIRKLGLKSKKYIHYVGRLTPENSVEDLIDAFKQIKGDFKCVIVGDSVHESSYKNYLLNKAKVDRRIIFTGFLNGKEYEEVCTNSYLYVETKEVGGIHPSLLEAMAFGLPVIAKKQSSHIQVLQKNGIYYTNISELQNEINNILSNSAKSQTIGIENKRNVIQNYQWKRVVKQYETLFVH